MTTAISTDYTGAQKARGRCTLVPKRIRSNVARVLLPRRSGPIRPWPPGFAWPCSSLPATNGLAAQRLCCPKPNAGACLLVGPIAGETASNCLESDRA